MTLVAFRCDGGARVGAGHVARSLQLALAFRGGGNDVVFAGAYDGVAAAQLERAGVQAVPALPPGADAVVVDSYEVPREEVEELAGRVSVAVLSDGGEPPAGAVVLDYHADARGPGPAGLAYVPVAPTCVAARRARGFAHALLTGGGGGAGAALREEARAALARHGLEVIEPDGSPGLERELRGADVAVSAAGVTAYELVCAGVPAALVAVVDNQERVARTLAARGLALAGAAVEELVGRLADGALRAGLAAAGPAAVDGYGAFRARDALRAAFAGHPLPEVLGYRPARAEDSERQLAWRNDAAVREASWQRDEVTLQEHDRWYRGVLEDPARTLLVIEGTGGPLGSVRFDLAGEEAEISLMLDPASRGRGLGAKAIREASELFLAAHPGAARIRAELRADNAPSRGAFARAGFAPAPGEHPEGRLVLMLDRAALAGGAQADR